MESILVSIKKMLGIDADYKQFDSDIIMHINSVLYVLTQMGVGPPNGFKIEGEYETWTDFISSSPKLESVKSYIYLKVKMMFDPPLNSAVIESMKQMINELEWRISVTASSE